MSGIAELSEDPKTALKGKGAAVVVFYAAWCGDCRASEEFEQKLVGEFAGRVEFFRLDAVNLEDISDKYEVERYPTWVFFSRARPLRHHLVEPMAEGEARNWVEMRLSDHLRNTRK
jgi:thiol-disulfide isomerase/thioredoxin